MALRPLRRDEIAYLTALKAVLDGAFQSLLLTLVLLALPFLLMASAIRGAGGDRLALVLGGLVLLALIGGVVYYSGLGRRSLAFGLRELRLRQALAEDLTDEEALEETLTVTGKQAGKPDRHGLRPYYLQAGDRRLQVSGPRWLNVAPGQELLLETARHSGVVLSVDGMRDRLPSASGPHEEALQEPFES